MPDDGLDAEKLQVLARWAAGLRADQRGELAAAGRAIELLIEEVERLHVLLWGRRLYPAEPAEPPEATGTLETVWARASAEPPGAPAPDAPSGDRSDDGSDDVGATLRRRLLRRFHSESPSHP